MITVNRKIIMFKKNATCIILHTSLSTISNKVVIENAMVFVHLKMYTAVVLVSK